MTPVSASNNGPSLRSPPDGEGPASDLQAFLKKKFVLERPVFFIPGPGDDNADFWTCHLGNSPSMKQWIERATRNAGKAFWVNFVNERKQSRGNPDLAGSLHKKILALAGSETFDVVAARGSAATVLSALKDQSGLKGIRQGIFLGPTDEELEKLRLAISEEGRQLFIFPPNSGKFQTEKFDKKDSPTQREVRINDYRGNEPAAASVPGFMLAVLKILSNGSPD